MKNNWSIKLFIVLLIGFTSSLANAQDVKVEDLLPLDGLNFFVSNDVGAPDGECEVSYNASTHVITYSYGDTRTDGWGYAGWDFRTEAGGPGSVSFGNLTSITIQIEPNLEDDGELEFSLRYAGDVDENGNPVDAKFSTGNSSTSITIELDKNKSGAVEYVYLKSQKSGNIKINGITSTYEGEPIRLNFNDFAFIENYGGWTDRCNWADVNEPYSHYAEISGIGYIAFEGCGKWVSWSYGWDGKNYMEYDYVRIDFAEPAPCNITLEIIYNPEGQYPATIVSVPEGSEFIVAAINKEVPGEYDNGERRGGGIRDITIRAAENVELPVLGAYVAIGKIPDLPTVPEPDLIVTSVGWIPEVPQDGDPIVFFARVKNIGDKATPGDKKHGLTFHVRNAADNGEGELVGWSDHRKPENGGPVSIAPGEEVELTMVGGPANIDWWTYNAAAGPFQVRALVNDTHDFPEDYSNNWSEWIEFGICESCPSSIDSPIDGGSIYVKDGILFIKDYPANITLNVYNLLGQSIFTNNATSDYQISLQKGAYIVEIISNGKTYIQKVLVK